MATEQQHTPGEWTLTKHGEMPGGVTMYWLNDNTSICTSNVADAQLAKAAPDLLEALEGADKGLAAYAASLRKYNYRGASEAVEGLRKPVRAAIAKAKQPV